MMLAMATEETVVLSCDHIHLEVECIGTQPTVRTSPVSSNSPPHPSLLHNKCVCPSPPLHVEGHSASYSAL